MVKKLKGKIESQDIQIPLKHYSYNLSCGGFLIFNIII